MHKTIHRFSAHPIRSCLPYTPPQVWCTGLHKEKAFLPDYM